jgi:acyl-CoA synthetase (AMP-forming)/AMP-acid ligase II
MIISGGENIYCVEVENAIAKHPAVASCAVIGIPSQEWGELVHAVVVLKPGQSLSQDALYEHCKSLIAGYKCPRSLELIEALPISGAGKVLKTELRKSHWEGQAKAVN